MSSEQIETNKTRSHKVEKLLPEHLLKMGVPSTLKKLQEIVIELEKQQVYLELQHDEYQKARTDLKLLINQYNNLYDSSPVGYLTINRSGNIMQINAAGAALFGMERSSLINKNLQQFISENSFPDYLTFLEGLFTNQYKDIIEFELQRFEDSIIVQILSLDNLEGNSCIVTLKDVTAEDKAKLKNKEDQKFRIIFENLSHGIVICGLDGKVISANQAAKSILGLSFNQIETVALTDIFSNPIFEDGEDLSIETLPFMKLLPPSGSTNELTFGYVPKHSTHYSWIVVSAMTINIPDEDDIQFLISFDDITSQKNMVLYNTLTIREKQVFQMIIKGYGRKEISKSLDITIKTVDKHRENLMEKLKIYLPSELITFSKKLL